MGRNFVKKKWFFLPTYRLFLAFFIFLKRSIFTLIIFISSLILNGLDKKQSAPSSQHLRIKLFSFFAVKKIKGIALNE